MQTKYDYNVDDNGMFRLFPTGSNHYKKGTEVFNSYGRRNNRHLLLEYGFAIEDNMWERVRIEVRLFLLTVCLAVCLLTVCCPSSNRSWLFRKTTRCTSASVRSCTATFMALPR